MYIRTHRRRKQIRSVEAMLCRVAARSAAADFLKCVPLVQCTSSNETTASDGKLGGHLERRRTQQYNLTVFNGWETRLEYYTPLKKGFIFCALY